MFYIFSGMIYLVISTLDGIHDYDIWTYLWMTTGILFIILGVVKNEKELKVLRRKDFFRTELEKSQAKVENRR